MPSWYAYNGVGDPFIPASYVRMTQSPSCTGSCQICAVFLTDNTVIPATPFSANRIEYISDALGTQTPQPTSGPTFVLLKC